MSSARTHAGDGDPHEERGGEFASYIWSPGDDDRGQGWGPANVALHTLSMVSKGECEIGLVIAFRVK